MAVYVVPNRRRNYWGNVSLNLGNGLLGNVINGMFERDARAREAGRSKRLYEAVADEMTPQAGLPQPEAPRPEYGEEMRSFANRATRGGGLYDSYVNPTDNGGWSGLWDSTPGLGKDKVPGREDFLRGLARYGATEQQAKTLTDLYMNQFETADKLGYQDSVASRVRNLPMDVRGNPVQAAQSGLVAQAYELKPEGLWRYTAPNFEKQVVDLGDRALLSSFDPLTGGYENREMGYGLNPTKRYESDADTEQAKISAGAQRYVADRNYDGKWVPSFKEIYGSNGEVQVLNTRTGRVTDTGARSYPRGSGGHGGTKPLTPQQKLSIGQSALKSTEMIGSPEEKWNYILRMSGGDSEALDAMARAVFNGGQVPMAAAEFFRTGSARPAGQGGQPQVQGQPAVQSSASSSLLPGSATGNSIIVAEARSRFPQETRGMSDEEVLAELMKYK
ncbi:hypothetical protein [Cloacibacillus porcorum]|uniref:hypothetical protein n=1 Tax=Cloacibacillus porcorum TaxID=1197717 RepID=UPI003CFDC8C9